MHLIGAADAEALRNWILSQLPGPQVMDDLGYGPWLRSADQALIERRLDLRELTPKNQLLFNAAVEKSAKSQVPAFADEPHLLQCLLDLADMVARADRGEPPLERSNWREIVPSEGRRVGPGWEG